MLQGLAWLVMRSLVLNGDPVVLSHTTVILHISFCRLEKPQLLDRDLNATFPVCSGGVRGHDQEYLYDGLVNFLVSSVSLIVNRENTRTADAPSAQTVILLFFFPHESPLASLYSD